MDSIMFQLVTQKDCCQVAVWPDLAKFRQLGKILDVFGKKFSV